MVSCKDPRSITELLIRVADPHYFNADPNPYPAFQFNEDPDPTVHFNADPDPAPQHSDAILRPLVYRLSTPPLLASKASTALF